MKRFWVGELGPRYERPQRPLRTPIQHDYRYRVAVEPQKSPAPIRYGLTPARTARRPRYSVLARRDWRSVTDTRLLGDKKRLVKQMSAPRGRQKPVRLRSNIQSDSSRQRSYGTRFTLVPQEGNNDPRLAEMGF